MPNIFINPNSGMMEFTTGTAGGGTFNTNFTGGAFATRLGYDNYGGLNLTSYVSNVTGVDRFTVDGANGRLFSVTDNLSGSLFSVNDIAGLPIIEAFDDNTVIMGGFNRNDFVLTGNALGLGAFPNTGTTKLYVGGNVQISGGLFVSGNAVLTGSSTLYATSANLASTGSTLATNLASTGSTLDTKINNLSGYVDSKSIVLPTTIIYSTGDQIISGIKNFTNNLVLQDNLLQSSKASGYLTGIGYSGNYDGGYFLGRTRLSQNTSRLIDSSFGNTWVAKDSNRAWYRVSISSDGKYQTAVVDNGQIYVSSDYGNSWAAKDASRNWRGISISSDGKYQSAFDYNGQIYVSSDYGNTWTAKDSNRAWWGISISSDGKYQTAVVVGGRIYVSSDYGNTWTAKDSNRAWYRVSISSDGKYQTAIGNLNIYVSSDYGNTWAAKDSSRNWTSISISSDGKYQTAIFASGQIYVSSDYGNSWIPKESNRNWYGISVSSDGKYQTAVVWFGQIYVSSDYGNTWVAKNSNRAWYDVSISSDGKYISAVNNGGQIYISKTDEQIDGNLYVDNFYATTGNFQNMQVGGVNVTPSLYATSANLASTGSTLATNLASTGSTLDTKINTLSGYVTGANATFASITNLASTGSTLDTKINTLSGYVTGANATFASITNLASTGSTLDTKINNVSGYFTGTNATLSNNLASTGTTLATNLANTGSTLNTKIDNLSGASVLTTTNQNIFGNKRFQDSVYINNLFVTGTETIVSTNNFNVQSPYLVLNLTGGAIDGGIFFITGSGLTGINDNGPIIGFDHSNKFKFGISTRNSDLSTLPDIASVQNIQALSGVAVLKFGDQTIAGNKNFTGDINLTGNNNRIGSNHYLSTEDGFVLIRLADGSIIFSTEESCLFDNNQVNSVLWDARQLRDANNHLSIYWNERYLANQDGTSVLTWTGDNIGIGTNNPSEKLQVNGNIKFGDEVDGYSAKFLMYDGANGAYNTGEWTDSMLVLSVAGYATNKHIILNFQDDTNSIISNGSTLRLPSGKNDYIAVDSEVVHITGNETISGIKTFANGSNQILNTTYSTLTGLKAISGLLSGQLYRISDFVLKWNNQSVNDQTVKTAASGEPLIVTAISNKQIYHLAQSEIYPQDTIYYDIDAIGSYSWGIINNNEPIPDFKGWIYRRVDNLLNIDIPYDWRNITVNCCKPDVSSVPYYSGNHSYNKFDYVIETGNNSNRGKLYYSIIANNIGHPLEDLYYWTRVSNFVESGTYFSTDENYGFRGLYEGYNLGDFIIYLPALTGSRIQQPTFTSTFTGLGTFTLYYVNNIKIEGGYSNVILGNSFYNNTIGNNFYNNIIDGGFIYNTIGSDFTYNTIGGNFSYNTIENSFSNNNIFYNFLANTIGYNFSYNTTSYYCSYNTIGNSFSFNLIKDYSYYNTIGNNFTYNTIQQSFNNNTIGNNFNYNTIGNSFYYNTIGNNFNSNTIGEGFSYNTIGNGFVSNTIGSNSSSNTIANNFEVNTVGNSFNNNTIGNSFNTNTIGNNFYCNISEDSFYSIDFTSSTHVYNSYNTTLFRNSANSMRLRYFNSSDQLVVTDPTA